MCHIIDGQEGRAITVLVSSIFLLLFNSLSKYVESSGLFKTLLTTIYQKKEKIIKKQAEYKNDNNQSTRTEDEASIVRRHDFSPICMY